MATEASTHGQAADAGRPTTGTATSDTSAAPSEIATVVASGSSPRLMLAFQPAWHAAANSTVAKTRESMGVRENHGRRSVDRLPHLLAGSQAAADHLLLRPPEQADRLRERSRAISDPSHSKKATRSHYSEQGGRHESQRRNPACNLLVDGRRGGRARRQELVAGRRQGDRNKRGKFRPIWRHWLDGRGRSKLRHSGGELGLAAHRFQELHRDHRLREQVLEGGACARAG